MVDMLAHYREKGIYSLHAFVVMPEHIHVLLTPASEVSLERAIQHVKGGSARDIGAQLSMQFPVWQRGYTDHRIRDERDFGEHVRYIEQNPLKRRLALAASEYPWSSATGKYALDTMPEVLRAV